MEKRLPYSLALMFVVLQTFAQTYTYDKLNRLEKVVYENGVTVTYGYDALGNRISKNVVGSIATKYTITVSVTPSGSGSVTGGGTYSSGSSIELKAIPNAGYKFSKWSNGKTDNPLTIKVTGNQSFTAEFVESSTELVGDIVADGVINRQDLNALVDAYTSGTAATKVTDLDGDTQLTIADVTKLISMLPQQGGDNPSNTYNGHEYVDLGLPSGTLWATCNVGATVPEEGGCYYASGETTGSCDGKSVFNTSNYKYFNNGFTKYNVYADNGANGYTDNLSALEDCDDAALANWGGKWHTPTKEDLRELINSNYTEWEWTTRNGTPGVVIKSIVSGYVGNSIFLPAEGAYENSSITEKGQVGWYMSSTFEADEEYFRSLLVRENRVAVGGKGNRAYGVSVRPVVSKSAVNNNENGNSSHISNGHEYVDLGLPSGTLWATCNVGANKPEDTGCYYAWAETSGSCDGKTVFDFKNYKYNESTLGDNFTKYCYDPDSGYNGFADYLGVLETSDDAASVNWGGAWRTPTKTQMVELGKKDYTSWEWTSINGTAGWRVTSKIEGFEDKSIFLPAAGMFSGNSIIEVGENGEYWTTDLYTSYDQYAKSMYFKSTSHGTNQRERNRGLTVRPVISKSAINQ